jgi:putative lipoic acid-binding regulatory protein
MESTSNPEEFYAKLKAQLSDTSIWPAPYLYKFIVPTDATKITQIESIFDNTGAVIETKESRTGKYTSISINVRMKNPDTVISYYKEVGQVEGVISL